MAKRQITNDDGSKGRKQVELNLNPVSIQPTISNGGNYRVAVQQTPKTNAALQLSEALKSGVQLYGKGVKLAQTKAVDDVESMSEADFDTFLNEGLDEESRSIFGYTKAYNQALAKKYYTQELPKKLQSIASDLHKDPYQYKTPEEFDAAASEAVSGAYDEADALLGGNVFGEQANNALKSKTMSDFVAKQQATYLARLPEITKQTQEEIAFQAFDELTAESNVLVTLEQQMGSNASALGNVIGNKVTTTSFLDTIELKIENGDLTQAAELIGELDSTDEAILNGQGRRKIDGVEIFNTKENRLRLEELEDKLENAGVSKYNANIANSKIAQSVIELEAFGLIAEAKGDETTALARFEAIEADIRKGSVTLNGVDYTDTLELNEIRKFIAGARNNKDLFVHNAKLNFVQQNTGSKRAGVSELLNARTIQALNSDASAILFEKTWESGRNPAPSQQGVELISDFNSELEQLELQLADSLLSNTSLSQGDKITEYSKLYPAEVAEKMQEWLTTRLNNTLPVTGTDSITVSAQRNKDAVDFLDEKTRAKIKASAQGVEEENELLDHYIQEVKDDVIAERTYQVFETKNNNLFVDNDDKPKMGSAVDEDGNRILRSDVGYGTAPKLLEKSYDRATENNLFRDTEERIAGHAQLVSGWQNPDKTNRDATYRGTAFKDRAYARYLAEGYFFKDTPIEKAAKRKKMVEHYGRYGVDISEVITDEANFKGFTRTKRNVTISEMFGGEDKVDFRRFPITVNGSVETVALTVSDYFKAKEAGNLEGFDAGNFARVAEKYFKGDLDALMTAQRTYLLQHKFITK